MVKARFFLVVGDPFRQKRCGKMGFSGFGKGPFKKVCSWCNKRVDRTIPQRYNHFDFSVSKVMQFLL